MPFQNWPRIVKNIVFLTFNSSIKQRLQKMVESHEKFRRDKVSVKKFTKTLFAEISK